MTVNVYLDTCVLSDESFVDWLSNEAQGVRASISSVVYMERRRQLLSRGRDPEKLELMLREANMADVMILSNIKDPQALLVTRNVRDFLQYLPESRIKTPEQICSMFRWNSR